jgi:hypothetical protein
MGKKKNKRNLSDLDSEEEIFEDSNLEKSISEENNINNYLSSEEENKNKNIILKNKKLNDYKKNKREDLLKMLIPDFSKNNNEIKNNNNLIYNNKNKEIEKLILENKEKFKMLENLKLEKREIKENKETKILDIYKEKPLKKIIEKGRKMIDKLKDDKIKNREKFLKEKENVLKNKEKILNQKENKLEKIESYQKKRHKKYLILKKKLNQLTNKKSHSFLIFKNKYDRNNYIQFNKNTLFFKDNKYIINIPYEILSLDDKKIIWSFKRFIINKINQYYSYKN